LAHGLTKFVFTFFLIFLKVQRNLCKIIWPITILLDHELSLTLHPPSKKKLLKYFEKIYLKYIQPIMVFLAHGLMNFVPTFKIKLYNFEKKSWQNFCRPMMFFWTHGLTNVQPTSKKSLDHQNLTNCDILSSWFNKLIVKPTFRNGPKGGLDGNKSIRSWNIIHNAFNVDFFSIYIPLIPWSLNLVENELKLWNGVFFLRL
jgi:hypothetical protein